MDSTTTLDDLKRIVQRFCEDREWDIFHTPKDLAIGLSTESNELLELFRFKSDTEIQDKMKSDLAFKQSVEYELADTLFFLLRFAQRNAIDVTNALHTKVKHNAEKYPVETSKGSNKKYNE